MMIYVDIKFYVFFAIDIKFYVFSISHGFVKEIFKTLKIKYPTLN